MLAAIDLNYQGNFVLDFMSFYEQPVFREKKYRDFSEV